jgi:hypothetical protein
MATRVADRERGASITSEGSRVDRPTANERNTVSVLIRFAPASLTAAEYDSAVAKLTADGVLPADGLDYEICFGSGDNFKVSQVWDSKEQLEAFGARLGPILAELGINPGEPEIMDVHNIIKR